MVRTEGQRLLREVVAAHGRGAQREIARRVHRSDAQISYWVHGENIPDVPGAVALEREYGIPVPAWTQKANWKRKAS